MSDNFDMGAMIPNFNEKTTKTGNSGSANMGNSFASKLSNEEVSELKRKQRNEELKERLKKVKEDKARSKNTREINIEKSPETIRQV